MAKQQRNNDYYLQRLKKDRPDLHREVVAGRITVNKARQLAGLGATRTRLTELKHAWKHASPRERAEFSRWAGLVPSPAPSSPVAASKPVTHSAFDGRGVMAAWSRKRVLEIMTRRGLAPGDLAIELGLERFDQSVMTAVRRETRIRSTAVIVAVEEWLARNASV